MPGGPSWRIRGLLSNAFPTRVLAAVGIIGGPLSLVQFFYPDAAQRLPPPQWAWLTGGGLLALVAAAVASWPPAEVSRKFTGPGSWKVIVRRGDLFTSASPIIVTADRRANTSTSMVGDDSLVAGLVRHWFAGTEALLESQIAPLRGSGSLEPAGTTFPFTSPHGYGLLFCLAEPSGTGSRATWRHLVEGLDTLWDSLRSKNLSRATLPLIGSGYARVGLSVEGLLAVIILSFHSTSMAGRVVGELEIIISDRDYSPALLAQADRILRALSYS